MKKIQTLCLIREGSHILLAQQKDTPGKKWKKGVGLWNGLGGHVEEGESIEAAARREVEEEAGVRVPDISEVGVMDFRFTDGEECEVHIFGADGCEGEPSETTEMKPQWFPVSEIPYDRMWPADYHWMPYFLAGRRFKGRVLFGPDKEVLEWEVERV